MAEFLTIDNFNPVSIVETTALAEVVGEDATVLPVVNGSDIPEDSFAIIGTPGTEACEVRPVSTVSGDTLTLGQGLDRAHARHSLVTIVQADVFKIYRAAATGDGAAPPDEDYVYLNEVELSPDSQQTRFVDATGGVGFWYKVTQFNSLTALETALGDAVAVRGGGSGEYATLAEIRDEAGLDGAYNLPDATISRYRRRAQALVDSSLGRFYVVPFNPVPDAIREVTVLIAAGYLLLKEYGEMDENNTKAGGAKLGEGKDWLKTLYSNAESGLVFIPGAELQPAPQGTQQVYGWPDDTTADTDVDEGGGARIFRIGERF